MDLCRLKHCCFVLPLKTGCYILGFLGLLVGTCGLAFSLTAISFFNRENGGSMNATAKTVDSQDKFLTLADLGIKLGSMAIATYVEIALLSGFEVLISILLLLGVYKDNTFFILSDVIGSTIILVIGIVELYFERSKHPVKITENTVLQYFVLPLVIRGTFLYSIIVKYSYRNQLLGEIYADEERCRVPVENRVPSHGGVIIATEN